MPPTAAPKSSMKISTERQRLANDGAGKRIGAAGGRISPSGNGARCARITAPGSAWEYFPHDHARSRAYRWGEDGIAGFSDEQQILPVAGPVERPRSDPQGTPFRPDQGEGNHGEDVKELYYYLDATPTHSYLKMLYKYPQAAFPYARLVEENPGAAADQPEFELLDTGIFDDDRYFECSSSMPKPRPTNAHARHAHNRGPEPRAHCCRSSGSAIPGRGSRA